jgi:hypothetical protein
MSQQKRPASSPAEKPPVYKKLPPMPPMPPKMPPMPPKKPSEVARDPSKGSLIRFEVVSLNAKPFYGSLSEVEIIHIWEKVLGRSRDEIFGMSYNRSLTRNFKVTFKLTAQILTSDLYPEPIFEFHRQKQGAEVGEDEVDVFTCKFIGYLDAKPAELGKLTRVTAKTNDFTVDPKEVFNWLIKFGSVNAHHEFEKNSLGLHTDVMVCEIVLHRHIPEYLPIAGRKVQINYPGIPKACNNCYNVGHMKRNCKTKKKDWLDRVAELRGTKEFEDEMFGGWISILEQRGL